MRLLITGGAGFIGSNYVRWLFDGTAEEPDVERVVVLDALTYAGNLANLSGLEQHSRFRFVKGDIRDSKQVAELFAEEAIDTVVNFAAETHVDRSIMGPLAFVRTNVEGTQVLLDCARQGQVERFLQVSTDEVYGSLGPTGRFTEESPLQPSSAYSASKAGGDLLVLAAHTTHGLHTTVSRCSNNYGPYQFPEKLIPLFVTNALAGEKLPLYGDGGNVRSWLHVDDHSRALMLILKDGRAGEVYNIGGSPESEKENVFVTREILRILGKSESLICFVEDRKGHDRRYAVDYSKIREELGWEPVVPFEEGLARTVQWYVDNSSWWKAVKSGEYRSFYDSYYGERLRAAEVLGG